MFLFTALTGIAADNLGMGATTLHSYIGLGYCKGDISKEILSLKIDPKNTQKKMRWIRYRMFNY